MEEHNYKIIKKKLKDSWQVKYLQVLYTVDNSIRFEDVLQSTYLDFKKQGVPIADYNPSFFLLKEIRKRKKYSRADEKYSTSDNEDFEGFEDISKNTELTEVGLDLKEAIKSLEEDERFIIEKIYYEGYSEKDTAKLLGRHRNQIYRIRLKALKKLKCWLTE